MACQLYYLPLAILTSLMLYTKWITNISYADICSKYKALEEEWQSWPQVHHPDDTSPAGAANLNYRQRYPGGWKELLGCEPWKVKSIKWQQWPKACDV